MTGVTWATLGSQARVIYPDFSASYLYSINISIFKGTVSVFQVTFHAKTATSDQVGIVFLFRKLIILIYIFRV